jgi:hypothetical protein
MLNDDYSDFLLLTLPAMGHDGLWTAGHDMAETNITDFAEHSSLGQGIEGRGVEGGRRTSYLLGPLMEVNKTSIYRLVNNNAMPMFTSSNILDRRLFAPAFPTSQSLYSVVVLPLLTLVS